jgi:hypothetical protein
MTQEEEMLQANPLSEATAATVAETTGAGEVAPPAGVAEEVAKGEGVPKQSESKAAFKGVKLETEFREFARFYATPRSLRDAKTQGDFAKKFGVSQDTLSDWKQRPEFWHAVETEMRSRESELRPDVLLVIRHKALQGDLKAADVWLKATRPTFADDEKVGSADKLRKTDEHV